MSLATLTLVGVSKISTECSLLHQVKLFLFWEAEVSDLKYSVTNCPFMYDHIYCFYLLYMAPCRSTWFITKICQSHPLELVWLKQNSYFLLLQYSRRKITPSTLSKCEFQSLRKPFSPTFFSCLKNIFHTCALSAFLFWKAFWFKLT